MKSTYSLLFIIYSVILHGQNRNTYDLTIHEEFKTNEKTSPVEFLGSDSSGHYLIYEEEQTRYRQTTIKQFNNSFIPTGYSLNMDMISSGYADEKTLGIIELGKERYYCHRVISKNKVEFYAKKISLNPFTVSNAKKIVSIQFDNNLKKDSFITFQLSQDSSCIGVFYNLPTNPFERQKFELKIFDFDFNEINHIDYDVPFVKNEFFISYATLIDSNELIFIASGKNNNTSDIAPDYKYTILSLQKEGSKLIGNVDNEGKWLHQPHLQISNDQVKFISLYSKSKGDRSDGVLYHVVDKKNSELIQHSFTPYTKNIYAQERLSNPKLRSKEIDKIGHYKISNILNSDDGTIIISEQVYANYNYYFYPIDVGFIFYVPVKVAPDYSYENLMILKMNDAGEIVWSNIIKKDNSYNDKFSSYFMHYDNEKIRIIFNDNIKNHTQPEKRFNSFEDDDSEAIVLFEIALSGTIEKTLLATHALANGFRIVPHLCVEINQNKLLLLTSPPHGAKKQKFMTLDILDE